MGKVLVQIAPHGPKQPAPSKAIFPWPTVPSPEKEMEADAKKVKRTATALVAPAVPTFFCR